MEPIAAEPIDPQLRIGSVALAVSDLQRSSDFYERVLGLDVRKRGEGEAVFGTRRSEAPGPTNADGQDASGGQPGALLTLREIPEPRPAPPGSTGLFHVAWLHPSRAGLAETVRRVVAGGWTFDGASDHGVSEALYLTDPDGLGIEIYADRPRERWQLGADGHGVRMVTLPLDIDDLLAQFTEASPGAAIEPGTGIGHVHLKVADVARASDFYAGVLGFEQQARLPSAAFLSAGGYHHHVGLNSWQSHGGAPAPETAPGLREVGFVLSDADAVAAVAKRAEAAGVAVERPPGADDGKIGLRDPDGELLGFATPTGRV